MKNPEIALINNCEHHLIKIETRAKALGCLMELAGSSDSMPLEEDWSIINHGIGGMVVELADDAKEATDKLNELCKLIRNRNILKQLDKPKP